jgi:hypothetical protein
MADEIVGSHLKSQRGRGQNQDLTGSWTDKKTQPIIPNVAPPNASADAGDWQTGQLKGGNQNPTNVPNHSAMAHPRTTSDGSPGGKIPSKTNHTAKR